MKSKVSNKKNKFNNNLIKFIFFVGLCLYVGITLISQQFQIEENKHKLLLINSSIENEQQINEQLKQKREVANTPSYLEKIAREKLGMAAPDEIIFMDATQKK